MSAVQGIRRIALRIALVLLSGGLVVVATFALTRPDLKRPSVAVAKKPSGATDGDMPFPGGEEALRLAINKSQRNQSDQSVIRQQLPAVEPLLADLGPMRSLVYLGSGNHSDIYRAAFENGSLIWRITMGRDGTILAIRCSAPEGPTAQDWIDHYALDQTSTDIGRLVLAFAKFLAIAGLGRFTDIRL